MYILQQRLLLTVVADNMKWALNWADIHDEHAALFEMDSLHGSSKLSLVLLYCNVIRCLVNQEKCCQRFFVVNKTITPPTKPGIAAKNPTPK